MITNESKQRLASYTSHLVYAICVAGTVLMSLGLLPNSCLAEDQPAKQQWSNGLVDHLMNLYPGEEGRWKEGVLELKPVMLPEGKYLLGNNVHFGWPVGTLVDDTLIVVFHRIQKHGKPTQPLDEYYSRAVVIRSTDGGNTWSEPFDLNSLVPKPTGSDLEQSRVAAEGIKIGFGNAIGTTKNGDVIVACRYGVFCSHDRGETWTYLADAFTDKTLPGPSTNIGPRLLEHPTFGLIVPGHENYFDEKKREILQPTIWFRYSHDGGRTWSEARQKLPVWCRPAEPTAVVWNDAIIFLTRNHGGFDLQSNTWSYAQLWSADGSMPFNAALTNIHASYTRDAKQQVEELQTSDVGPYIAGRYGAPDTSDLSYNPVTTRLEAICTNRQGGAPGREDIHDEQTLNLWSIDPEEILSGKADWRFEGTLLRRRVTDGQHPAGAVIDIKRGVQHVFIYLGKVSPEYPARAGIFQLTRTLDTPKLREWLATQLD